MLPLRIFSQLISLEWLFLDVNLIEKFDLIELQYLQKLKWLNISNNHLTLNDERFPKLKSIIEM